MTANLRNTWRPSDDKEWERPTWHHTDNTMPPCPNCDATDSWAFYDFGNKREWYSLWLRADGQMVFRNTETDNDTEESWFYCTNCRLNEVGEPLPKMTEQQWEYWDVVNTWFYEKRNEAEWQ